MLLCRLSHLIFVFSAFVAISRAQRRIKGGRVSEEGKRYVVYLVKAPISPMEYDAWLCGGAIVSQWHIITSAACVEDVQHIYAIAGFKRYIPTEELDNEQCTKQIKKKVVFTCMPKPYELDYARVEKWAYIDIAVVKVESAYNFEDTRSYERCDYVPGSIRINYETKHQEPGMDAMVLGWGHLDKWRKVLEISTYFPFHTGFIQLEIQPTNKLKLIHVYINPGDKKNYNQEELNYASTLIHDKEECKEYFKGIASLSRIIDKYMICTLEGGNIDDAGNLIQLSKPIADGCTPKIEKLSLGDVICEEDETILLDDETRKQLDGRKTFARILQRQQTKTRRQGFCQNDHGGPLVTWVGGHEILIGVASVFRVTNDSLCTGPYLYTSTQCNGAFIDCILNMDDISRRSELCDKPPKEKGFDTIKRSISWEGHPDGPADNERIMMRPVSPLGKWPSYIRK